MKTAALTQNRRTRRAHRLSSAERGILNDAPAQRTSIDLAAVPPYLRDEWEHFKGYGWSDHRTAERLGIQPDTVNKWAQRLSERIARLEELARQQAEAQALEALAGDEAAHAGGAHLAVNAQAIAC
ncbi:hypothetical protein [Mycobacteroides chelonae]|uniref:Uncharacterized protein n=1 Tax=Mycobacteroides chelonae TaxID=1774 RepID=A0A1S1M017_MYCCH|nr:hypothetical protein [Mycobacteroides chelonae]OHU76037.1 hypothetical protein BKG84_24385 [Mycobacteroides chelonae]